MRRGFGSLISLALLIGVSASPAHAAWTAGGTPLCNLAEHQLYPAVAADGAGGAIVAWEDYRSGTNYDVYAQRVDGAGNALWTGNGIPLATVAGNQVGVMLVPDGGGGAILAWEDARGGASDVYAQRVDASGMALWTPNGVPLCTAANNQVSLSMVADGAGGAIVTWLDHRESINNPELYIQRVDASGVTQWASDGIALCSGGCRPFGITMIPDNAGGAILAWQGLIGGTGEILAQWVGASGVPQWPAGGAVVCTEPSSKFEPAIASDGANGAIIAWRDSRGSTDDIYAQRIDDTGTPVWVATGVAVCQATNTQLAPAIVSDGSGGAIVTWQDNRGTADIYAQRLDDAGNTAWVADGVAVCTAADKQLTPAIITDGIGGAVITWQDSRTGEFSGTRNDIYARQLNHAGTPLGIANGIPLCTAAGNQFMPVLTTDGFGGALVAWYDLRSGSHSDVYAARLTSPPTGVGHTPELSALTVLPNIPNPFAGSTEIEIRLPVASRVTIEIYDVAGRRVRSQPPIDRQAGPLRMVFDGRDDDGRPLPSGVYFYRVTAAGRTVTHKMVIAR